jgi:hypothetical protein
VVPCIFNHSNKTTNEMQQSIIKFIALTYRHCSTCFGHYSVHSYGNQRLQRQFYVLLMMGIVMPETCWAVSVQQGNKFYDCLLHLVGCFVRGIHVTLWVQNSVCVSFEHSTICPNFTKFLQLLYITACLNTLLSNFLQSVTNYSTSGELAKWLHWFCPETIQTTCLY